MVSKPFASSHLGDSTVKPFTFVHTADCHLDTPFAGIGREDPELPTRLRKTQRAVFDDLIKLCIDREAGFLVIAGDLYDVKERSLTTRVRLREAFRRLDAAGVQVFLATGNHDNLEETQRGLDFPPNVHIFSGDRPKTFLWPEEHPVASITGMSYARRAIEENLAALFPPPSDKLFSIAVLHCNVDGDPAHDNYAPCRRDELVRAGYNYWALGHVHGRRILAERPTTIVYPGCIQGRHVKETGAKGATVAAVDQRGRVRLKFEPLNRIAWLEAEADVSEVESEEELAEMLRARAEHLAAKAPHRLEGQIVRWHLVGSLTCTQVAVQNVLELLREVAFERHLFLWPESIDASRTVPPVNFDELADEETPRGDLVRLVEQIRKDMLTTPVQVKTPEKSDEELLAEIEADAERDVVAGDIPLDEPAEVDTEEN